MFVVVVVVMVTVMMMMVVVVAVAVAVCFDARRSLFSCVSVCGVCVSVCMQRKIETRGPDL